MQRVHIAWPRWRAGIARTLHRRKGHWAFQETPNPSVWKFQSDVRVPEGTRQKLLELPGVHDVFANEGATGTWFAVTRQPGTEWQSLAPMVRDFLQELAENDSKLAEGLEVEGTTEGLEGAEEILEVLEHRIRPSVQEDGGDVMLKSWSPETGEVVLNLQGACRGCPQSAVTLQESILKTLKHFVPQVTSVRSEEDLDVDATNPYADLPWTHHGEPAKDRIGALVAEGTPIFSTFAGTKVEGPKLRRISFMSEILLQNRRPEHIFVTCQDCNAKRTIEDPSDLLREDKGNTTGRAAVAICPTCCVVIAK